MKLQASMGSQPPLWEPVDSIENLNSFIPLHLVLSSNHREALLDKEGEIASLREKLRVREAEITRIREEEAQRATFLQNAILTYVQGSPLSSFSPRKWVWGLKNPESSHPGRGQDRLLWGHVGIMDSSPSYIAGGSTTSNCLRLGLRCHWKTIAIETMFVICDIAKSGLNLKLSWWSPN